VKSWRRGLEHRWHRLCRFTRIVKVQWTVRL